MPGLNVTIRNARLDLIKTAIDAGAGAGTLKFYTATRPATGAAITTQTLLGTVTFSDPSAAAASAGLLTFSAITGGTAVATGTATWARVTDSAGAFVTDMSVGTAAAEVVVNTVDFVTGGPISVTSAAITEGNA